MKVNLNNNIIDNISREIKGTLYENKVYVVGGFVRDFLMGIPSNDIDLLIDGDINAGIEFAEWFCKKTRIYKKDSNPVIYGLYGTAMFNYMGEKIESVAPRSEKYKEDSRNPLVTSCTIEDDCFRRDFTINSLFVNISDNELIDYSGHGVDDINNKIIRSTNNPEIIFKDDSLRILRAIRFACKYNFDIEGDTMNAMFTNADRLSIITQERITDEFNKMMMTDGPTRALCILGYTGAMKYVVPELIETYDMGQNAYHFGTVWEHTLAVVENNARACRNGELKAYLSVRLACVFHDLGKIKTRTVGDDGRVHFYDHETVGADLVREIMTKMRYPNDVIDETCFYIRNHMVTKAWGDDLSHMKMKTFRKLMYKCKTEERFIHLMEVIDADNNAHKKEHCLPHQVENIVNMMEREINYNTSMFGYKLPIDGNDVMEILGIEPGPNVKKYLGHCLKMAFNNPNITKEQCIKEIKHFKVE